MLRSDSPSPHLLSSLCACAGCSPLRACTRDSTRGCVRAPSACGRVLSANNLTGTLPTEIGELTDLTVLDVNTNLLSGTLPTEVGRLTQLHNVYVNTNSLSGTLPTEVRDLAKLTALNIDHNSLRGVPEQNVLDVEGNSRSGALSVSGALPTDGQAGEQSQVADLGGDWPDHTPDAALCRLARSASARRRFC